MNSYRVVCHNHSGRVFDAFKRSFDDCPASLRTTLTDSCRSGLEIKVIKLIGTAYKRDDFTTGKFFDYWFDVHAPISAKLPELRRYVVSEVVRKLRGELEPEAFVEQWYDDDEPLDRASATEQAALALGGCGTLCQDDRNVLGGQGTCDSDPAGPRPRAGRFVEGV